MSELDRLTAHLVLHWQSQNRDYVMRRLVGLTPAQAAYCAARLALTVRDCRDVVDALRCLVGHNESERATTTPLRKPRDETRHFSLSDLPDAADVGSFDVNLDDD